MNFFKSIFGGKQSKKYEPKITVEKIQHVFEYGKLNNFIGTGAAELKQLKVGGYIELKPEGYYYKGYKDIPAQIVPPHIKWQTNAISVFVAIVDSRVAYYYNDKRNPSIVGAPVTTDVENIQLIDDIFEHYYRKFNLPHSLSELRTVKTKADKTDKMSFLSEYLSSCDEEFFYNNFCDDDGIYNIAVWIDWREEDENIIRYCEDILQTGHLSAETVDAENERGFDVVVTYKGEKTAIPYKEAAADRDTTIKALNKILLPDYELRFCKESDGGDTLCFIPLSKAEWMELEAKHKELVEQKFEKIARSFFV